MKVFKTGMKVIHLPNENYPAFVAICLEHEINPSQIFEVAEVFCNGAYGNLVGMPDVDGYDATNFTEFKF